MSGAEPPFCPRAKSGVDIMVPAPWFWPEFLLIDEIIKAALGFVRPD
jgi:hypothetical protein